MTRITAGSNDGRGAERWIKSSLSFSNGNCVEVTLLSDGQIAVRDSKDPDGPVLRFTPSEWRAFLGGARNGEFDIAESPRKLVRPDDGGTHRYIRPA